SPDHLGTKLSRKDLNRLRALQHATNLKLLAKSHRQRIEMRKGWLFLVSSKKWKKRDRDRTAQTRRAGDNRPSAERCADTILLLFSNKSLLNESGWLPLATLKWATKRYLPKTARNARKSLSLVPRSIGY